MPAGAILEDQCFASQGAALDAYYSGMAPVFSAGTTSYLSVFEKDAGVWREKSWSIDSAGVHTLRYNVAAQVPTFPECDPAEKFLDGVVIGWGIAAAMVAAACYKMMERAAK